MNTPLVLKNRTAIETNCLRPGKSLWIPVDLTKITDSGNPNFCWYQEKLDKKRTLDKTFGAEARDTPKPGHRYQLLLVSREVRRKRIELRITLSYGPFLLIIKLPKRPLTANRPSPRITCSRDISCSANCFTLVSWSLSRIQNMPGNPRTLF